jgi:hypothetical protein
MIEPFGSRTTTPAWVFIVVRGRETTRQDEKAWSRRVPPGERNRG